MSKGKSEMNEDYDLDQHAEQCMELYEKMKKLLEGYTGMVAVAVLNRVAVMLGHGLGYTAPDLISIFIRNVGEIYPNDTEKGDLQ